MPLDIFPSQQDEASADISSRPGFGPGLDPSFGESFGAAWSTTARFTRDFRMQVAQQQAVQTWIDQFKAATGESPPNPEEAPANIRDRFYANLASAYAAQKTANPGLTLAPPPTADDAHAAAIANEQKLAGEAAAVGARPQTFGSRVGSVAGNMAAVAADPVNLAAMAALGPAEGAGVLATALREGAIAAGSQTAIEASSFATNREINPDYGLGTAAANIASAGAGGVLLGGGLKALGALWARVRAARASSPIADDVAPPEGMPAPPQDIQDAGNVVERAAHIADTNPHPGAGPEGDIAHSAAYAEAEKAAIEGRAPEIPQDQFTTGQWRPSKVFAADGSSVNVRYEVVDAAALVAAQRPDLSVNPDYPAELQPRDRTRAASAEQIAGIAARLDPERLGPSPDAATGSPIVGPDNVVESGNGRVLAIRQAYEAGTADAYRDSLQKAGFDTTGMEAPVLIARRTTPLTDSERADFAVAANRASALRLSAPEQALADARLMDGPVLDKLNEGNLGNAANRDFVRSFFAKLPQSERGGLIDRDGVFSTEGMRRVEAALLARAYGDPGLLSRILEDPDNGVKALAGSLTDVAGKWAAMRDAVSRGTIPAGMDITRDLLDAFRFVAKSRDTRVKLGDLIDQAHLFEAPSPAAKALLKMMFRNEEMTQAASRQAVARALTGYVDETLKNTTDERLFGEPLSQADVLNTALTKVKREDLAPAAEQATLPLAARKAAAEPATDDAVLHQLDNLRDASQDAGKELMVPDPHGAVDADGKPVMRSVNDLMNEADAEIKAAQEIEGCATGANDEAE